MAPYNPCWFVSLAMYAWLMAGCDGTRVLPDARPMETGAPLAAASSDSIVATLDGLIVRGSPGSWAANARWDEYLLTVSNHSANTVQLTGLVLVDSLETRIASQVDRRQLVRQSKKAAKRYGETGLQVHTGYGTGTILAAGTAVTALGIGAAGAAAAGSGLGAVTAGVAGTVAGGLLVLGPILVTGGIMQGVNSSAVSRQIEQRQTAFPRDLVAGGELGLDVFFPISPSPIRLELGYVDANGESTLVLDTRQALQGLHITPAVQAR